MKLCIIELYVINVFFVLITNAFIIKDGTYLVLFTCTFTAIQISCTGILNPFLKDWLRRNYWITCLLQDKVLVRAGILICTLKGCKRFEINNKDVIWWELDFGVFGGDSHFSLLFFKWINGKCHEIFLA